MSKIFNASGSILAFVASNGEVAEIKPGETVEVDFADDDVRIGAAHRANLITIDGKRYGEDAEKAKADDAGLKKGGKPKAGASDAGGTPATA